MSVTVDVSVDGKKCMTLTIYGDTGPVEIARAESLQAGLSLSEAIGPFLEYVNEQGKSASTVVSYGQGLRAFAGWLAVHDNPSLPDITPRHITDWKSHMQTVEGLQPATINLKLVAVNRLYHWAVSERLAQINPAASVRQLSRAKLKPRALTDKETQALISAAEAEGDLRNIAIVQVMLGTGLRVAELLALRMTDLILVGTAGQLTVRKGKGGKFRIVPVPPPVIEALKAYFETVELSQNKTIWRGTRGPLSTGSAIKKILNRLGSTAGITHIHPHMLRHTFAARYLAANPGDMRGLASLLGHASINTTMVYTEPSQDDLAERVQRAAGGV